MVTVWRVGEASCTLLGETAEGITYAAGGAGPGKHQRRLDADRQPVHREELPWDCMLGRQAVMLDVFGKFLALASVEVLDLANPNGGWTLEARSGVTAAVDQ